jgi:hypothetical protein
VISRKPFIVIMAVGVAMIVSGWLTENDDMFTTAMILIFISFILLILSIRFRGIKAKLEYDRLHVRGTLVSAAVPYAEISSTAIQYELGEFYDDVKDAGSGGMAEVRPFPLKKGSNRIIIIRAPAEKYIVVRYGNNNVLLFNLKTAEETGRFYTELRQRAGK